MQFLCFLVFRFSSSNPCKFPRFTRTWGAQPKTFQSKRGFVKFGHFSKHFVKNTKKDPARKIFGIFFLDTLKTTFWMENWTKRWIQSGPFFPKSGHFFRFSKKRRGGLPPSPSSSWAPDLPVIRNFDYLEFFA